MSSIYRTPELPWTDGEDSRRLWTILGVLLALMLLVGVDGLDDSIGFISMPPLPPCHCPNANPHL